MIIQHNIAALNSYRQLGGNNSALSANLEKLSSGYKINRAGDDAAGLAISEKMRAQITGLETAQKNAQDGISLVQTAEGALTEVHDMLNRMVELATQSSNGTYSDEVDRDNLQAEIDSLLDEIDRISESTNFNGIELLNGNLGGPQVTTEGPTATGGGATGDAGKATQATVKTITADNGSASSKASFTFDVAGASIKDPATASKTNAGIMTLEGEDGGKVYQSTITLGKDKNGKDVSVTIDVTGAMDDKAIAKAMNGKEVTIDGKTFKATVADGSTQVKFEATATGTVDLSGLKEFTIGDAKEVAVADAPVVELGKDGITASVTGSVSVTAQLTFDFKDATITAKEGGTATFNIAGTSVTIDVTKDMKGEDIAKALQEKLKDATVSISGASATADFTVSVSGSQLIFTGDKKANLGDLEDKYTTVSASSVPKTAPTDFFGPAVASADGEKASFTISLSGAANINSTSTYTIEIGGKTISGSGNPSGSNGSNLASTFDGKTVEIDGMTFTAKASGSDLIFTADTEGKLTSITDGTSLTIESSDGGSVNGASVTDVVAGTEASDGESGAGTEKVGFEIKFDSSIKIDDSKLSSTSTLTLKIGEYEFTSKELSGTGLSDIYDAFNGAKATIDGFEFTIEVDKTATTALAGDGTVFKITSSDPNAKLPDGFDKLAVSLNDESGASVLSAGTLKMENVVSEITDDDNNSTQPENAYTKIDFTGKTGKDFVGGFVTIGETDTNPGTKFEFVLAGEQPKDANAIAIEVTEDMDEAALAALMEETVNGYLTDNGLDGYTVSLSGAELTIAANDSETGALSVKFTNMGINLQVGDTNEDYQKVKVTIDDMDTKSLGIDGLDISTQKGAEDAIAKIKDAINKVSEQRGKLGAVQNRLDHTINNLGVTTENITAAESRIRDTDMASEMMEYTKNNILIQASQAMLAQANTMPQGVLQLLQ